LEIKKPLSENESKSVITTNSYVVWLLESALMVRQINASFYCNICVIH